MKWFGRKAAAVPRPFLLRGWHRVAPEPWPPGYEAQVREAYLGNPMAQRAVERAGFSGRSGRTCP